MNELPVIGYPHYTQRTLGSPGGKHCKSLEGIAKSCFDVQKKNDFGERSTFFRRYFMENGFGNVDTRKM